MSQISFRSGNSIIGLLTSVIFVVIAFYALKGLFWILAYLSPVLLIATLIIDHNVVVDYLKMLWNLLKTTPFFGLLCCGLSVFALPVIIFYLFGKVMLKRQAKKFQERFEARYANNTNFQPTDNQGFTPYEEVETKLLDDRLISKGEQR
jgi:hypothetical protein